MPKQSKGAYLALLKARREGIRLRPATWVIRDGSYMQRTGCGAGDRETAEGKLAEYITKKYAPERTRPRDSASIPVADALTIYLQDVAPRHARPDETAQRVEKLIEFFGDKTLSNINGALCRAYVEARGSLAASRRELEDLRSAINHHRREGICNEIISIALPDRPPRRERWLTRSEAARLLWAAWRARQMDANAAGEPTKRAVGKHIARFVLVGLYSGTRSSAICGASLDRLTGRGFIDLDAGVFYRRAEGERETKKRKPAVPLHPRLLAHLRRWGRLGLCQNAVVEWGGKPVARVSKGFARAARAAGLEGVSPHVLRHTAVTWSMQNGAPLWEAAAYFGMTVEMLEKVYGHHHPDHLKGAVAAIGGRGRGRGHKMGTK